MTIRQLKKNIKNHKSTSNINYPKNINTVIKNPYYKEKDDKDSTPKSADKKKVSFFKILLILFTLIILFLLIYL